MACLKVINSKGVIRLVPESLDLNVRGVQRDEYILESVMSCGEVLPIDDLTSLVTSEGIMVGNVIKKVTNALGIKQCMACRGRQQRYNEKGLAIQRKLKDLL